MKYCFNIFILFNVSSCQLFAANPNQIPQQDERFVATQNQDDLPKVFSNTRDHNHLDPFRHGTMCKGGLEYNTDEPCPYYLTYREAHWYEKAVVKCFCVPYLKGRYAGFKQDSDLQWSTQGVSVFSRKAANHAVEACWELAHDWGYSLYVKKQYGDDIPEYGLLIGCSKPVVCYESDSEGQPLNSEPKSSDDCIDPDPS